MEGVRERQIGLRLIPCHTPSEMNEMILAPTVEEICDVTIFCDLVLGEEESIKMTEVEVVEEDAAFAASLLTAALAVGSQSLIRDFSCACIRALARSTWVNVRRGSISCSRHRPGVIFWIDSGTGCVFAPVG